MHAASGYNTPVRYITRLSSNKGFTVDVIKATDDKLSQGQHVYDYQGVASDEGFNHVSKLWYPKTISFEDGMEKITQEKRQREDILFQAKDVRFQATGKNVLVILGDRTFSPTAHAAKQVCNWFKTPQTLLTFYKEPDVQDMEVLEHALNNGKRAYADKDKPLLFRTYQDGTLRGLMSDKYSTVDNVWYLELLQKLIPGGRLSHWKGDADTIYGNILIPDTIREEDDSDYGGLLNIGNCEIGRRVIFQTPSLFRAICCNGILWGETKGIELRQRHIRIDLEELREAIKANIGKQIPLLTIKLPELLNTHNLKAEVGVANLFAAIAKRNNLTTEVTGEFMVQWDEHSNEKTAFGVIDAVTRAGQKFDADTWFACDSIGGALMREGEAGWNRINSFAKSLTDKDINKAFGIAA